MLFYTFPAHSLAPKLQPSLGLVSPVATFPTREGDWVPRLSGNCTDQSQHLQIHCKYWKLIGSQRRLGTNRLLCSHRAILQTNRAAISCASVWPRAARRFLPDSTPLEPHFEVTKRWTSCCCTAYLSSSHSPGKTKAICTLPSKLALLDFPNTTIKLSCLSFRSRVLYRTNCKSQGAKMLPHVITAQHQNIPGYSLITQSTVDMQIQKKKSY